MKKIFLILLVLSISITMVNADVSFPDLTSEHWAYTYVENLVNDGTIRGYEDGTFQPDGIVTRAEFVKMIDKGDELSPVEYSDVPNSHWAYEYVMYSGLKGKTDSTFEPDTPITRGDVAELIWKRNGSDTTAKAPACVIIQGSNPNAAAWVYEYGIMNGNDGANLRLSDTLTRAEAAALIVRARNVNSETQKKAFMTTVDGNVLRTVYNGLSLIDNSQYEPSRKITNGEMCMAAVRYLEGKYTPSYKDYKIAGTFDSSNARAVGYITNMVLGGEKNNADFADKTATISDTIAAFSYALCVRTGENADNINGYYKEITDALSENMNKYLTYANEKSIFLYQDGKIDAKSELTAEKFAAIIMQFDSLSGFSTSYKSSVNGTEKYFSSLNTMIDYYPQNSGIYKVILSENPIGAYESKFNNMKSNPTEKYDFCHSYSLVFTNAMESVAKIYEKVGTHIDITFFPSMVCDNGNGVTMRLKVNVNKLDNSGTFGTLFDVHDEFENTPVTEGMTFYADFITGQPIAGIVLPVETMEFTDIVFVK